MIFYSEANALFPLKFLLHMNKTKAMSCLECAGYNITNKGKCSLTYTIL